jgi:hypothetical protein
MNLIFWDKNGDGERADGEKRPYAAYVIKSASGSAVHVSDPLGDDKVRGLVTPQVIKRSSAARRRAGVA